MAKHSNGTWRKGCEHESMCEIEGGEKGDKLIAVLRGGGICLPDQPSLEEREANAALIIAAPEMLAMLRRTRQEILDRWYEYNDDYAGVARRERPAIIAEIDALIAKAEPPEACLGGD